MNPITVSLLNAQIARLFEQDERLRDIWVTGEVSNWKRAASGHVYFNLKDRGATIGAVMWKGSVFNQKWLPNEGDQIVAHGYVGVYSERGVYQLYANQILPAGRGQLYEQLEELKARLAASGLFDPARKRPIVAAPRRIGVITSADAAALRDILRVLAVRWPLIEIIVFPTLVQGVDAPPQIVSALAVANDYAVAVAPIDTLIIARGGGSIEDLWAFNNEAVAYAVAQSAIPVVTGVGHETDFTIVDFVADLRAPTPSAAAVAVAPDRGEVLPQLATIQRQLSQAAMAQLSGARNDCTQLEARLRRLHPQRQIDQRRQRLDDRNLRLDQVMRHKLERWQGRIAAVGQHLAALNPSGVLQRGYSIVRRADGVVVRSPEMVDAGEHLDVRTAGGEYRVQRIGS